MHGRRRGCVTESDGFPVSLGAEGLPPPVPATGLTLETQALGEQRYRGGRRTGEEGLPRCHASQASREAAAPPGWVGRARRVPRCPRSGGKCRQDRQWAEALRWGLASRGEAGLGLTLKLAPL